MSTQAIYANPFRAWAELLRGLRQRYVRELGLLEDASVLKPQVGELLGAVAGLINECEALGARIDALERKDPEAFTALQRALEL